MDLWSKGRNIRQSFQTVYPMNRRSFLKNSALALLGFSVLPPAKSYERIWKARAVINPAYANAYFEYSFLLTPELLDRMVRDVTPIHYRCVDGAWQKIIDSSTLQA